MIVVSGEALLDVFSAGGTPTGLALDARIGGSPLNVAVGLARLAQPVAFFGAIGHGFLGDRLMQALHDEQVDTRCTVRLDAPTTLGFVGLDAQGVASYAFYGAGAADRQLPLSALSALDALPPTAAYAFGSYTLVVEPVATTLRALVERVHAHSAVAYDINVRLNVEPDLQRWHDALHWMLPRTTLLKLSDEDLALLFPRQSIDTLVPRWLAAGVALVVLTRGGDGASAYTAAGRVDVAPVPVQVVDTVGAGDTFQAALLTALNERGCLSRSAMATLDGATLEAVLGFAARAAALTCSRRGADLPRRADLPA